MTGLASHAHLRDRLAERYRCREAAGPLGVGALVVVEAAAPGEFVGPRSG